MKQFYYIVLLVLLVFSRCNASDQDEHQSDDSVSLNELYQIINETMEFNDVTQASMSQHYDQFEAEFTELQVFINSKLNDSQKVDIEFRDEGELRIFHVGDEAHIESNWDVSRKSVLYDSLLNVLGWTDSTISQLNEKLNQVDCISIGSYGRNKTSFGYKRDGFGLYEYIVHDSILDEESKGDYWACSSIFYRDNVLFEYGGGAIGSDCFPEKFMRDE